MENKRVLEFAEIAVNLHNQCGHLYDGKPYETHLKMVYGFGLKYINLLPDSTPIQEVLIACWTHDLIEDCRQTYNDIKEKFSPRVAEITYALTNEKGKTRKERANDKYYEMIKGTNYAVFVKLCDRLANIKYSKDSGSRMFEMYKKEHYDFKDKLCFGSNQYNPMWLEMEAILFN